MYIDYWTDSIKSISSAWETLICSAVYVKFKNKKNQQKIFIASKYSLLIFLIALQFIHLHINHVFYV